MTVSQYGSPDPSCTSGIAIRVEVIKDVRQITFEMLTHRRGVCTAPTPNRWDGRKSVHTFGVGKVGIFRINRAMTLGQAIEDALAGETG